MRCAAEAKGLTQNRSCMLDCGFERCEIGSRLKCSKVGALKDPNFVIEALDLAGAKRSDRLPCARLAEKMRWRLKRSTRELCEASDFVKARWPELSVMTEHDETIDA